MKGALENQDNGEKSAPSSRSGPSQDAFPPSSQQSSFSHSSDAQRRYKRRDDGVQTLGSDGRRFRYKPKLKVPKIPEHLRADAGLIRSAVSLPGGLSWADQQLCLCISANATFGSTAQSSVLLPSTKISGDMPKNKLLNETLPFAPQPSEVMKEFCMCCTPWSPVSGMLTATRHALTFEPDMRVQLVRNLGIGRLQVYIDIQDVIACAAVMLPDGPLVTEYFGFSSYYGTTECSSYKKSPGETLPESDDIQPSTTPAYFQVIIRSFKKPKSSKIAYRRKTRSSLQHVARRRRKESSGSHSANSRAAFSRVLRQLNYLISQRSSGSFSNSGQSVGDAVLQDPPLASTSRQHQDILRENGSFCIAEPSVGESFSEGRAKQPHNVSNRRFSPSRLSRPEHQRCPQPSTVVRMHSMPLLERGHLVWENDLQSEQSRLGAQPVTAVANAYRPLDSTIPRAQYVSRPQRLLSSITSWARRRGNSTIGIRSAADELEPLSPTLLAEDKTLKPHNLLPIKENDKTADVVNTPLFSESTRNTALGADAKLSQAPSFTENVAGVLDTGDFQRCEPSDAGVNETIPQLLKPYTILTAAPESEPEADSDTDTHINGQQTVLFRFLDQVIVRQLTSFVMDSIDARDEQLRRVKDRLPETEEELLHRHASDVSQKTQHVYSAVRAPPAVPTSLTVVPFSSNEIFEAFLLSSDAQVELLMRATKRLTSLNIRQPETFSLISTAFSLLRNATQSGVSTHRQETVLAEDTTELLPKRSSLDDDLEAKKARQLSARAFIRCSPCIEPYPDGAPILLTSNVAMQLADFLSPTLLLRIWKLGFCTQLHGLSFTTFFRRLSNMGPCIFLICDTQKTLFGAFCSISVREASHYYGTGECFVFTFKRPETCTSSEDKTDDMDASAFRIAKYATAPLPDTLENVKITLETDPLHESEEKIMDWGNISVYPWTKQNSFFVLSTSKMIAFGGGGSYAVTVDSNFLRGSSASCATYGNPCLASSPDFLIRHLQVWYFADL